MLDFAANYAKRGWSVIPIPFRSKNPGLGGWQQLRLTPSELAHHFNGQPQNIGVLLGEPSEGLVDVDLDHELAVKLAPEYLPSTALRFGRSGKPESHYLYRVTAPVATKKHRSNSTGMIVELRSTGSQTVFPPSTHESGELISFVDESAEPATVNPQDLLDAVKQLANAVLVELSEKLKPSTHSKRSGSKSARQSPPALPDYTQLSPTERIAKAMEVLLRLRIADHNDGSLRLFSAACRCVEYELNEVESLGLLQQYSKLRPFPKPWSDDEILKRITDARQKVATGSVLSPSQDPRDLIALGQRDPESGRIVLSPSRTLPTAEAYIRENHQAATGRTLHYQAGVLWEWNGSHYVEVEEGAAHHRLLPWLHDAVRYSRKQSSQEMALLPFEANPNSVKAALDSIKSHVHLPVAVTSPSWLDQRESPLPQELLVGPTSLLHLPTGKFIEPTPQLFVTSGLEFDIDQGAPQPMAWLSFMHDLFDGDLESLELLQEWFGYLLTADTTQQKMLLVVGPRRSGKGTIARVMRELVGTANVCGPTTSSLGGSFGLQPLVGKSLAIVSDARFAGKDINTVSERLLAISGEDAVSIDRKYHTSVTMKLPTRFVFLTNEVPRLADASGALASRFMVIHLSKSFFGQEDPQLTTRLLQELPGILNWAIAGWHRLRERGHFVMPSCSASTLRTLEELGSPITAFVGERCVVQPGLRVSTDDLYREFERWSEAEGRVHVSTKAVLGRDLAAAFPEIKRRRGTDNRPFYEGLGLRRSDP